MKDTSDSRIRLFGGLGPLGQTFARSIHSVHRFRREVKLSAFSQADAVILIPSVALLVGAVFGVVRGVALVGPGVVRRADYPRLFWATVSASALVGTTGVLVVGLQMVDRLGTRDVWAYGFMLLLVAVLTQSTINSAKSGITGYFYSLVRRTDNPGKFRWALTLYAIVSCAMLILILASLAVGHRF